MGQNPIWTDTVSGTGEHSMSESNQICDTVIIAGGYSEILKGFE